MMRLLRLRDVQTSPVDRVFRYSPMRIGIFSLALACAAVALVLVDWEGRRRSTYYVAYYVVGVLVLGLVLMRRLVLARLRSSNWLVRMRDDGLLIQFRSYLNYHLPGEDVAVVSIPYQDIRSARLLRERTEIPAQDGNRKKTRRLVELELAGDVTPLSKAFAAESAKPGPREKTWHGNVSTLYRHYPVRMVSLPFLQVEWSVVPQATVFLDALRTHTKIAPPVAVSEDFLHIGSLSGEEQEKRLHDLDQRGETIAAIQIAARIYGYDLNRAKAFVEGLRPRP